jgi:hypothetical protein
MKLSRYLIGLALAALLFAAPRASYAGAGAVSVTTASTQIVLANDVGTYRNYILMINIGNNPAWCAQKTSNAATTLNGIFIGMTGFYELPGSPMPVPPNGSSPGSLQPANDWACISVNGGTTIVYSDY